ncbi:hypothetical protein ACLOJK_028325 [Asimina triloba]
MEASDCCPVARWGRCDGRDGAGWGERFGVAGRRCLAGELGWRRRCCGLEEMADGGGARQGRADGAAGSGGRAGRRGMNGQQSSVVMIDLARRGREGAAMTGSAVEGGGSAVEDACRRICCEGGWTVEHGRKMEVMEHWIQCSVGAP